MAFRPLVVPNHTVDSSAEAEIARAEHEALEREKELAAEVGRLESAAGGVLGQLQQMKAAVAKVQLAGANDPGFQDIQRRAQQAGVPRIELGTIQARALQARREALQVRARAGEEMRQLIQSHAAELSRLASQLAADEAEVARFERQLQQEAARPKPPPPPPAPAAPEPAPLPLRPEGRREKPRVRMQAAIDFNSESNFFTGFSTNLSEGGIFIATVKTLPLGTPVDLGFTLPGGTKIALHGVVRWIREVNDRTPEIFPGIGVQFTELSPEAAEAIKVFVASREPMFYPD